jgi:peptide/nickel transport system substrate-binding protein
MGRLLGRRGVTSAIGALVLVIIVVVAGGLTGVALNSLQGSSSKTVSVCSPPTSPVCQASSNTNDVTLLVPVQSGFINQSVPLTASLPTGETASSFTFSFGDGSTLTATGSSNSATVDHTYTNPGVYLIQVTALVGTATHTNNKNIGYIQVLTTYSVPAAELVPAVTTSIVSNGSGAANPTGVVAPGSTVTFMGSYTAAPVNPAYASTAPKIAVLSGPSGGASITSNTSGPSSAQSAILFSSAGTYTVGFNATATSPAGSAYQENIYTVVVGTSLAAKVPPVVVAPPSLKGTIVSYDLTGGSPAETLDPAIDYETIGFEPIANVYQVLITYNQSSTTNFIPELAACVPGSAQCTSLFGSSLVSGYNLTFVISGASNFYDPATKATWGVYPSDVVFSFARTASFAVLPSWGGNNGWVTAQAYLPLGNKAWDTAGSPTGNAIHYPGNNTPAVLLDQLLVNDSAFCPAGAYTNGYHGCVTVVSDGLGQSWTPSAVYQLLADPLGGAITPASWINAQGAGLPGWNISASGDVDHPVPLPGDTNPTNSSTQNAGVQSWISWAAADPTMWDTMQIDGSGVLGSYQPFFSAGIMAGSGPYYLSYFDNGVQYILQANPGYNPNPNCRGSSSCQPAVSKYVHKVVQNWETTQDPGIAALESGTGDFAAIPSTQTSLLLQLLSQGKIKFTQFPTLGIYFFPYDWNFNLAASQALSPTTITAPTNFFSNEAIRALFSTAYPYQAIYKAILDVDGISIGVNYGGAIAPGFQYYPTNVSWPNTDPSPTPTPSVPGSAWWWWAQVTNPSSPYYSAEIASKCTSSSPCTIPIFGQTGNPPGDIQNQLWINEITKITGGAINAVLVDVTFLTLVLGSLYSSPGNSPLGVYTLGWSPDYPGPYDYVNPLWNPNSTYTYSDGVAQQSGLYVNSAGTGCPSLSAGQYAAWSAFASSNPGIPQACQGIAYQAMIVAEQAALHSGNPAQTAIDWAMVSQIGRALFLYTYQYESIGGWIAAPWINIASVNTQLTMAAGGLDNIFYAVQGNGILQ